MLEIAKAIELERKERKQQIFDTAVKLAWNHKESAERQVWNEEAKLDYLLRMEKGYSSPGNPYPADYFEALSVMGRFHQYPVE